MLALQRCPEDRLEWGLGVISQAVADLQRERRLPNAALADKREHAIAPRPDALNNLVDLSLATQQASLVEVRGRKVVQDSLRRRGTNAGPRLPTRVQGELG